MHLSLLLLTSFQDLGCANGLCVSLEALVRVVMGILGQTLQDHFA
jgi:hypothetical protein